MTPWADHPPTGGLMQIIYMGNLEKPFSLICTYLDETGVHEKKSMQAQLTIKVPQRKALISHEVKTCEATVLIIALV